jgi:hypothetical protein
MFEEGDRVRMISTESTQDRYGHVPGAMLDVGDVSEIIEARDQVLKFDDDICDYAAEDFELVSETPTFSTGDTVRILDDCFSDTVGEILAIDLDENTIHPYLVTPINGPSVWVSSIELASETAESVQEELDRLAAEFNKSAFDKQTGDPRSYNVGSSNYADFSIQPWDIWREYDLNPWDADIIKRTLRTKKGEERVLDYEKIIHICKERIRQINDYGKNKKLIDTE